jgi:hypothetical protein
MKIKLQEVLEIMAELKKLENVEASVQFSYAAMKNFDVVEKEAEILKKIAMQPVEGGEKYRDERQKLVEIYVAKDDRGNIKTERKPDGQTHYTFTDDNQVKFLKELKILDEASSQYIKDVQERQNELDKLAGTEVEIKLTKVKLSQFPNKISARQMRVLSPMIDEGENDK